MTSNPSTLAPSSNLVIPRLVIKNEQGKGKRHRELRVSIVNNPSEQMTSIYRAIKQIAATQKELQTLDLTLLAVSHTHSKETKAFLTNAGVQVHDLLSSGYGCIKDDLDKIYASRCYWVKQAYFSLLDRFLEFQGPYKHQEEYLPEEIMNLLDIQESDEIAEPYILNPALEMPHEWSSTLKTRMQHARSMYEGITRFLLGPNHYEDFVQLTDSLYPVLQEDYSPDEISQLLADLKNLLGHNAMHYGDALYRQLHFETYSPIVVLINHRAIGPCVEQNRHNLIIADLKPVKNHRYRNRADFYPPSFNSVWELNFDQHSEKIRELIYRLDLLESPLGPDDELAIIA